MSLSLDRGLQDSGSPLITLDSVSKIYRTAAGEFPALIDFDAAFRPGEFVSVVGKSGSGKSTLVNMITGIDHPSAGLVTINGTRIHELSESQMSSWRGRNLGIIFQFFQLLPNLTLLENVMLPMDFCDRYPFAQREDRARSLLAQVQLDSKADLLPTAVSGGEQQRTAIARALANDPPTLIADEPTGNLDTASAENIFGIFDRLVRDGKTIVMVTHDMDLAQRTDRILLLSDGHQIDPRIVAAFPRIPDPRLLWLARNMTEFELEPGSARPIGAENHGLILVTSGSLEISLQHSDSATTGTMNLLAGGLWLKSSSSQGAGEMRAVSDGAVHLLTLADDKLAQWLSESAADRQRLHELAGAHPSPAESPRLRRASP
ncbi:MAG: ABC transporter ATP-binding protein [Anaerolineales bacterium]